MKRPIEHTLLACVIGAILAFGPLAMADDPPPQKVVISLQQDPGGDGLEAACVALQLGMGLMKSGAEVTLFATLDGIYIADAETYGYKGKRLAWGKSEGPGPANPPICDTLSPEGVLGEAPLEAILFKFLDAGGEILLCPLCNAVRQPYDPIAPGDERIYAASPMPLLMGADKVIDY